MNESKNPNNTAAEQLSEMLERETRIVESANREKGCLNVDHTDPKGNFVRGDGINCPICLNKGYTYILRDNGNIVFQNCTCAKARRNVWRVRESGLGRTIAKCTFANFSHDEQWQQVMYEKALEYSETGAKQGHWLLFAGQSGSGKTFLCTAVAGVLMKDYDVTYTIWPQEAQRLKGLMVEDSSHYDSEIERLQRIDVLIIDDFWKPSATSADKRMAYTIINQRYVAALPTIISTEFYSAELAEIDEAVTGRIVEMCGQYKVDIGRDKKRNYRLNALKG